MSHNWKSAADTGGPIKAESNPSWFL